MDVSNTAENFRAKINEVSTNYQNLLRETHTKALFQNEIQTKRWEAYKKDHVELSDRLLCLRDKLSEAVMVPLGKKALMRGRLVHTNEVMVCLGDGWFAKQTAKQASDICHRRIQHCDEMLNKLKKEEELLNSRRFFPFESEAFGGGDQTQEIIEPFDEEEDKLWREKHRQKEKEYRKKLAELREVPKTKIETEEDLWRRLDALDMQEELEDELNRMEEGIEDDEEEEDEDSEDDSDSDDETYEEEEQDEKKNLQRRVSFKEEKDNCESNPKSEPSDDNVARIVFKHSDTFVSVPSASSDEITTPYDIYLQYLKQKTPKSILKPSVNYPPVDLEEENPLPGMTASNVKVNLPVLPAEPAVQAVGEEVVECAPTVATASTAERPISRFKAARMASKR